MKKSRTLILIALIALLVSISLAAAASNDVPVTALEDTVIPIDYGEFAPPECAGMTFEKVIRGYGPIQGSNKNDLIFLVSDNNNVINNEVDGDNGDDCIVGGAGDDHLVGGNGRDVLLGGAGNDHLEGGNQDDDLLGGAGDDLLEGNNGKDTLWGGDGNDHLNGGEGNNDNCWGGDGSNTFDNCEETHDP